MTVEATRIHIRVGFVLRLLDTTTGLTVEERAVSFYQGERRLTPISRGNGNFVFTDMGQEEFTLSVNVRGYESGRLEIHPGEQSRGISVFEVYLIPQESVTVGEPVLTLAGKLEGLEELEAVSMVKSCCNIAGYDAQKRVITQFRRQGGGCQMEDIHYGLIHDHGESYEHFTVEKQISPTTIVIRDGLMEEFPRNAPIARVIFGQAAPDGTYLLRVRDDGEKVVYLVRYRVDGTIKFQTVDFHCPENTKLW